MGLDNEEFGLFYEQVSGQLTSEAVDYVVGLSKEASVMESESDRVASSAEFYLSKALDLDKDLVRFRFNAIRPYLVGERGLELGSANGVMTAMLAGEFASLTAVDGSAELLAAFPDYPGVSKVQSLFEEFETDFKFDTVVMDHILEHVEDPVGLLSRASQWIEKGGIAVIGVPNSNSLHRQVAVKMGLLRDTSELNDRDIAVGHRRVYSIESLVNDIEESGLRVLKTGGVFLKPLSNLQIQEHWSQEMIEGFNAVGSEYPHLAAEIFAICSE